MRLSADTVSSLLIRPEFFTVTRVTVRVSASLGGYLLDIEAAIPQTLGAMDRQQELGEMVSVSGVVHDPDRTWGYAFRIDESGAHVAANATPDALQTIGPLLDVFSESP